MESKFNICWEDLLEGGKAPPLFKRLNLGTFVLDVGLQGLREKGQGLLDQISNQASWAYGKDVTIENKENVDHIQGVMEDMQLRKQRQSLTVNVNFC